jgi:hypothetical protein
MPHDLLILDDSTIRSMARNPNFTSEFPVLKSLNLTEPSGTATMSKNRCNDCSKSASVTAANFNAVKVALTQLGSDKKKRLLKLLNAKQIRIQISVDGKRVRHTISD